MWAGFGDRGYRNAWRRDVLLFALGACALLAAQWLGAASCTSRFDLLHPEVACHGPEERSEWEYEPLRLALAERIAAYAASGTVPHIALYFRDLHNGHRFAIREEEIFNPASLLKVPVMLVILHYADRDPALLDERLTYEKQYGKDYSVGEGAQAP